MGYPVAYRGGRSPQRGPQAAAPDLPPLNPGPFLAIGVMAWAFGNLMAQLEGLDFGGGGSVQSPGSYGWTLTLDCGYPPLKLPAAGFTVCGVSIVSKSAWEVVGQNPLNPTVGTLQYWDPAGSTYNTTLNRYENCRRAQRWSRLGGANFSPFAYSRPAGYLLGGPRRLPLWLRAALGVADAGYDAPAWPLPGRLPGFDQLDDRWVTWYPGLPGSVSRPVPQAPPIPRPVARAVPATGMREVKFNANTRAGRMFFAMYATFNLLGDGLGLTRALWFSIPKEQRGSSMRFRNMAQDIWENWRSIDPLLGASNIAKWKFLDTLYGGTQAAMFNAIAAGYGHTAARLWATLESEINATTSFQRRKLEREQRDQRGG